MRRLLRRFAKVVTKPEAQRFERAGLALLFFVAAVIGRLMLDHVIPGRLPLITFFAAVLLSALYCATLPSVLVLALSAFTGTALIDAPVGEVVVYRATGFTLFVLVGGSITLFVQLLRDALEQLRAREAQLALINREQKHRMHNLFAAIDSICQQTIRDGVRPEEMLATVSGRVHALARAQDLLDVTAEEGARVPSLVSELVKPMAPTPSRMRANGPDVAVPGETTTPFALILHELATNALKHGAWSSETGSVSISWRIDREELAFEWQEHDGPAVPPPSRKGLGTRLIRTGLRSAKVDYDLKPDGLQCRIRLPLINNRLQTSRTH
jgi:two-component sensor histidine kinase